MNADPVELGEASQSTVRFFYWTLSGDCSSLRQGANGKALWEDERSNLERKLGYPCLFNVTMDGFHCNINYVTETMNTDKRRHLDQRCDYISNQHHHRVTADSLGEWGDLMVQMLT